ncbi:uncharacterized protein [Rutidosis leptorrhynchoides]|uniref:uncharacterized protein isoform X2 n=1 Tax=Rutidosis leptorrhynchoides TaxID=125765 RepID=UPI003A99FF74
MLITCFSEFESATRSSSSNHWRERAKDPHQDILESWITKCNAYSEENTAPQVCWVGCRPASNNAPFPKSLGVEYSGRNVPQASHRHPSLMGTNLQATNIGHIHQILDSGPTCLVVQPSVEAPKTMPEVEKLGPLDKRPGHAFLCAHGNGHPWIRNDNIVKTPFDISIMKFVKRYICASKLRKATLRALSKTQTFDELFYFKEQFSLLKPSTNGYIRNVQEELNWSLLALKRKQHFIKCCALL